MFLLVCVLNSSPPFAASFLSFQFFLSIRCFHFAPLVSTFLSSSFTSSFRSFTSCSSPYVLPPVSLVHPVRFPVHVVETRPFRLLLFPLVWTLAAFQLLFLPFRFKSYLPFATSFLSFQLPPSNRYFIFRFNASIPFICSFLSFQVVHVVRSVHSFHFLTLASRSFSCSLRCNLPISFVTSILWFQIMRSLLLTLSLWLLPSFAKTFDLFVSTLPFHSSLAAVSTGNGKFGKETARGTFLFKVARRAATRLVFAPQAATCVHLPPLSATRMAASGWWLQLAAGGVVAFLHFKYRVFCDLKES